MIHPFEGGHLGSRAGNAVETGLSKPGVLETAIGEGGCHVATPRKKRDDQGAGPSLSIASKEMCVQ